MLRNRKRDIFSSFRAIITIPNSLYFKVEFPWERLYLQAQTGVFMSRRIFIQLLMLMGALGLGFQSNAQVTLGPNQTLETVSESVLDAVRKHSENYKDTPQALQSDLLKILEPALDFNSFSRGVMGRYHKDATPEQRAAFTNEFKATLVELYTSALVAAKIKDIDIVETTSKKPGRANVVMDAKSNGGDSYLIQYSMRQNDDDKWLIRNIIIDGVNIGLTYRNQFKSAMETENEDLARVVKLWPQIIEGQ